MHRITRLAVSALVVIAVAGCGQHGGGSAGPPADAAYDARGWAVWRARAAPVYEDAFNHVASDPSVVRDGAGYRMAYTGTDFRHPDGPRASLCIATSADGFAWTPIATTSGNTSGMVGEVLRGREGSWEEDLEGAFLLRRPGDWLLYYSGYTNAPLPGSPAQGFPAALSVARSTDGMTFARVSNDPILSPTVGGYDDDAIYSPDIVAVPGGWLMVYAGHAYDVGAKSGNRLLAATSPDGLDWTKEATPILEASPAQAWRSEGVAEPDLVPGPDGRWYLFFTGLQGAGRVIGVASGPTPRGPWEVDPDPIVVPRAAFEDQGVLAPSVLIEGDRVRMWYLGHGSPDCFVVGYAEAAWPLRQPHAAASGPRIAPSEHALSALLP